MTVLSQQDSSAITDKDRKIEALLQLQENSLLRIQNFELNTHSANMSEYMRNRDKLISSLHGELWVQQQINEEKTADIMSQKVIIIDLQEENALFSKKIKNKNKAILIFIGVDIAIILGVLLVR